jgi:hypothetical protein
MRVRVPPPGLPAVVVLALAAGRVEVEDMEPSPEVEEAAREILAEAEARARGHQSDYSPASISSRARS